MSPLLMLLFLAPSVSLCDSDVESWKDAVSKFDKIAHPFKQEFCHHLFLISHDEKIAISSSCRHGLQNFSSGLIADHVQEMAMFDSFSKPKPGMLTFSGYSLGAYHQCLLHGRYVYLGIDFPLPNDTTVKRFNTNEDDWKIEWSKSISVRRIDPFHFGICSPDSCSESDLRAIFSSDYVKHLVEPLSIRVMSAESRSDPKTKTWTQVIAAGILMGIVSVGTNAALINYYFPKWRVSQMVKPLDAYTNAVELFAPTKNPDSPITTITFIRVMYFINSVYMHVAFGTNLGTQLIRAEALVACHGSKSPVANTLFEILPMIGPAFMTLNVVLAGCFVIVKWVPAMMKSRITFLPYVMERVFRTWPAVAAYFLVTQMLPIIDHGGPMSKHVQKGYADVCFRNGWKELLFVNNFDELRDICNPIAWFMSADFQLYIPSFLLLLLIAKYPRHAVKLVSLQIIAGIMASGWLFHQTRVSPIASLRIIDTYEDLINFSARVYHTVNYIPVYAVGMMLGLKLLQAKGQRQETTWSILFLTMLLYAIVVVSSYFLYTGDDTRRFLFGHHWEVLFASLIRTVTAIAFALFFFCIINTTNPIILSLARSRAFTVIARLSLSWFLIHILVVVLIVAMYDTSGIYAIQLMMEHVWITLASFLPACAMYIFVEAPFAKLIPKLGAKKADKKD